MLAPTTSKVLITRSPSDSEKFAALMKIQGAVPVICPLIETRLRPTSFEIETKQNDWLIFTSVKGVTFFLKQNKDFFQANSCKVAVIGEATKQALEKHHVNIDFMPKVYQAQNMMEEFFQQFHDVRRIIHIKGNLALATIQDACKARGIPYQSIIVYETYFMTLTDQQISSIQKADYLTASSPSTIHALAQAIKSLPKKAEILQGPMICIGPTTASAAMENGFTQIYRPKQYTVKGMIEMIAILIQKERETIR